MVTRVLITTDTELSSSLHQQGVSAADNFRLTIEGRCGGEAYGIGYQMDRMEEYGLTGVFFIDPMPALVYGEQIIADIVGPIIERGHEAQLHIHTEWLEHARVEPVGAARGRNIGDFTLDEQIVLLRLARQLLIDAGAPAPTAFRAGNYGSNDETLQALARLGLDYDSSFNPAYAGLGCDISLPSDRQDITPRHGVNVVPISAIEEPQGTLRPAQICALSATEMAMALDHASEERACFFNIVSHSFELIVRQFRQPNPIMIDRFERLCRKICGEPGLESAIFADLSGDEKAARPLPAGRFQQMWRMGEQAVSKIVYEGAGPVPPMRFMPRIY